MSYPNLYLFYFHVMCAFIISKYMYIYIYIYITYTNMH